MGSAHCSSEGLNTYITISDDDRSNTSAAFSSSLMDITFKTISLLTDFQINFLLISTINQPAHVNLIVGVGGSLFRSKANAFSDTRVITFCCMTSQGRNIEFQRSRSKIHLTSLYICRKFIRAKRNLPLGPRSPEVPSAGF